MPPTSDEQIQFLVNLQRILDEGQFTASYKFALLLALADLSIEQGDESGAALRITSEAIAVKFIQYYWRQTVPYPAATDAPVLRQNTGKQAAILNLVRDARGHHGDSLPAFMNQRAQWRQLVQEVAQVVRIMPLWKLQTVGAERLDFLYENTGGGITVELRAGVTFCLRKFHALISDLVRGAWARYVRQQNLSIIGEVTDLQEFLFGSERADLAVVRPVLIDIQAGRCFYCRSTLTAGNTHVDHFVPWSRYPIDLGHNFVLADNKCNNAKRDRLPACEHLAKWVERNSEYDDRIAHGLTERGFKADLAISNKVTHWAYSQAEASKGLTWVLGTELTHLNQEWRMLLGYRR
jgi:5-methylcytosine-specific restriction endonuclease McrA